jgi:hypothetical protein
MTNKIYLHLNGEYFEANKIQANEKSKEDDENSKDYNFDTQVIESLDGLEFENGTLTVDCSNKLGYYSLDVDLDLDIVVQIIEYYMKKLGKLKTVLEATK